ncbi:MAG: ABC transporter ATP-binding protein [Rhodospirillaceae bacterium]|nr:ABC transporter ATP-binding protein [Rhodospirillaceae bacterium]
MLTLDRTSKRFANGYLALDGISLAVGEGEIVGIVGASGCGKSTLLRLLAGLERPSAGTAAFDGAPLAGPRDEIGVVFQEPRLMPWLSVEANVAFGLRHLPAKARAARVAETLERVGLGPFAKALPRELSGGMAQRAAIARALAARPKVLLLDEPFSALDAFTRLALQEHLLELWSYDRPTFVLVTHDIDEARALADRIVLMRGHPGRVHREFAVDLPRPRGRTAPRFLAWKEEVLRELHVTAAAGRTALSAPLLRAAV